MIEIDRSTLTKQLYAQDASMYEELPEGVAFPRNEKDIRQLVKLANKEDLSITARSAGTSLAGQATGAGIIMDTSRHMGEIISVDPEEKWAEVEPGVVRDTLNRELEEHGLLFGPDTATTNRCMLGGMIGNNSAGMFSIKYKTTRDHIRQIKAVLSDGSTATFGPVSKIELEQKCELDNLEGQIYRDMIALLEEHRELIEKRYPHKEIIRRNTPHIKEVWSKGGNDIERALYLIHLGDWASYDLSELNNVDVMEIKVIEYLKSELAKFKS